MPGFVHLRTHSHYSLLDGASSVDDLLDAAADLGQDALALTDTNGLYGAVRFWNAARERGIKPIFGAELRLIDSDPVTLLALDRTGQGVPSEEARIEAGARIAHLTHHAHEAGRAEDGGPSVRAGESRRLDLRLPWGSNLGTLGDDPILLLNDFRERAAVPTGATPRTTRSRRRVRTAPGAEAAAPKSLGARRCQPWGSASSRPSRRSDTST